MSGLVTCALKGTLQQPYINMSVRQSAEWTKSICAIQPVPYSDCIDKSLQLLTICAPTLYVYTVGTQHVR